MLLDRHYRLTIRQSDFELPHDGIRNGLKELRCINSAMPNGLRLTIKTKGTVIYIIELVEFDFVTN